MSENILNLIQQERSRNTNTSIQDLINTTRSEYEATLNEPNTIDLTTPTSGPYTEDDLVNDQYFPTIKTYMDRRYGADAKDWDKRTYVEKYTNNMRAFAGVGHSYRTAAEVNYLFGLDDDGLAEAGAAYQLYEGMDGLFSGETSLLEKGEIIQDFTRSAILDPINLLSLGVGKLFASSGTKSAAKTAQLLAMRMYKRQLAKGVAPKVAQKTANHFKGRVLSRVGREAGRRAAADRATTGAARLMSAGAMKEVAGTTAVDTAAAVGFDYAQQQGYLMTGAQEEYSIVQTGVSALGGLLMGGINAGLVYKKGSADLALADVDIKPISGENPLTDLAETIRKMSNIKGDWSAKVARGQELKDLDTDFWITLMLGDDTQDLPGLAEILYQNGYTIRPRKEEPLTNVITDVMRDLDPADIEVFMDDFQKATGIDLPETSELAYNELLDTFAKKMHDHGRSFNAMSQLSKQLNVPVEELTLNDYYKNMIEYDITAEVKPGALDKPLEKIGNIQNNLIRMLVSHPGTTARNVKGWAAASTINSSADLALSFMYAGRGAVSKYLMNDNVSAKEAFRVGKHLLEANRQKMRNLMDPEMTYEAFVALQRKHPQVFKDLGTVLPGGVDTADAQLKRIGFDPDASWVGMKTEEAIEAIQVISGVKAQDAITKSQEMLYQMDKNLRLVFDKGFSEFYRDPQAAKLIRTKEFQHVVAKSTDETLKSIFSKSYKNNATSWGWFAGMIEDARKIPVLGMQVPFGRFFNNTAVFMSDHSGLSFGLKYLHHKEVDPTLAAKAAVFWAGTLALVDREEQLIESGYQWDQDPMFSGSVSEQRWEFPYAPSKAIARIIATYNRGDRPSKEMIEDMLQVFPGQLLRPVEESQEALGGMIISGVLGDLENFERAIKEISSSLISQPVQAGTRFLDPINEAAALVRGRDAVVIDRKQGYRVVNDSLRYMDQILGLFGAGPASDKEYERFSAATGKMERTPGNIFGVKEIQNFTPVMRAAYEAGLPVWKLNEFSKTPAADNRFNRIFHEVLEGQVEELIKTDRWKKLNREEKEIFLREKMGVARKLTYEMLEDSLVVKDDRYSKMMKIGQAHGWPMIDRYIEEISPGSSIEDLSRDELEILEYLLKTHKERVLDK